MDTTLFEPLLDALKKRRIEVYNERYNSGKGRSLPFGIINRRNYGVGRSRNNKRYPRHYEEALKLGELIASDIPWTTIMINDNYQSLPHYDKGNDGESWVVGFGDYEGGELNVENTKIDIKYKPYKMFAGEKQHWTEPWTGNRYSIVFFRIKLCNKSIAEKYKDYTFKQMDAILGTYEDADSNHKLEL